MDREQGRDLLTVGLAVATGFLLAKVVWAPPPAEPQRPRTPPHSPDSPSSSSGSVPRLPSPKPSPMHHPRTTQRLVRRLTDSGVQPTEIHKIVLTGGPCGGKSTAMARLSERMKDYGFTVYLVPEMATLTIQAGCDPGVMSRDEFLTWEANLLTCQIHMEDAFTEVAKASGRKSIIVCDRGCMDVKAYMSATEWETVVLDSGMNVDFLSDKRYTAVIHLVSAAKGAEAFYTTANNAARRESLVEAIVLDDKLKLSWNGHSNFHIIDNSTDFEGKINRTVACICKDVGMPAPSKGGEKRFLVSLKTIEVPFKQMSFEQVFLQVTAGESRLTRKGTGDAFTYVHQVKTTTSDGKVARVERVVSGREYVALVKQRDPSRETIKKIRQAFVWEDRYYKIDTFIEPSSIAGQSLLYVELPEEPAALSNDPRGQIAAAQKKGKLDVLPPFVTMLRDVSDMDWFSTYSLADKDRKDVNQIEK